MRERALRFIYWAGARVSSMQARARTHAPLYQHVHRWNVKCMINFYLCSCSVNVPLLPAMISGPPLISLFFYFKRKSCFPKSHLISAGCPDPIIPCYPLTFRGKCTQCGSRLWMERPTDCILNNTIKKRNVDFANFKVSHMCAYFTNPAVFINFSTDHSPKILHWDSYWLFSILFYSNKFYSFLYCFTKVLKHEHLPGIQDLIRCR